MPAKQRRTQNFIGRGNARYRVFTGTGSSEHIRLFSFSLFITFLLFGSLRGIKRVVGKLFITLTASPLVTETIAPSALSVCTTPPPPQQRDNLTLQQHYDVIVVMTELRTLLF